MILVPEPLKTAVESQHGGTAMHVQSVHVKETFAKKTVWEGVVEVFDTESNPRAMRAYAWSSPIEESDGSLLFCIWVAFDRLRIRLGQQAWRKIGPIVNGGTLMAAKCASIVLISSLLSEAAFAAIIGNLQEQFICPAANCVTQCVGPGGQQTIKGYNILSAFELSQPDRL